MHNPVRTFDREVWRDGIASCGTRRIAEETAIALTYNGGTYAVMMGTPQHLREFAVGFSLTEGVVQSADEIESIDVVVLDDGIELRMWLHSEKAARINERLRHGIHCGGGAADRQRPARTSLLSAADHDGDGRRLAVAGAEH